MRSLTEINEEKTALAKAVFVRAQIAEWERVAKLDAEANKHMPPQLAGELACHVYTMAWSARRYKIARAKRDAAQQVPVPARIGGDAEADDGNRPVSREREFSATSDAFQHSADAASSPQDGREGK